MLANVAVNLMTTTDVMMLGWLSPHALAAGALGQSVYTTLLLFCIGVVGALAPLAASLVGADRRDFDGLRAALHQTLASAFLLAAPAWLVLWNAGSILRAIGEPPDLAADAAHYLHALQWALAPALLYFATRSAFAALDRVGPTLVAGLIAVVFNAGANYVLIFGKLGLPALGVVGSGLATTLSQTAMLLILIGWSFLDPHLRRYRLFAARPRFDGPAFAALWRLGLPIGATTAAEVAIFGAAGLAMGLIGPELARSPRDRAADRLGRVHGPARPRPGGERARRPRLRRPRRARGVARRLDRARPSPWPMSRCRRRRCSSFRDCSSRRSCRATPPTSTRSSPWRCRSCRSRRCSSSSTERRRRSPTCCAESTTSRWPAVMAIVGYWAIGAPIGVGLAFFTPLQGRGLWIGLACGLAATSLQLLVRWRGAERSGFRGRSGRRTRVRATIVECARGLTRSPPPP